MNGWTVSLKVFAYVVLALLAAAMAYAAFTAVKYWPAISV